MPEDVDPPAPGPMAQRLRAKLEAAFAPLDLRIVDDSERHRGHGGWREGGETHFNIEIVSAAFEGQSRVARHRAVNACLAEELSGPVHALSLAAHAPSERSDDA